MIKKEQNKGQDKNNNAKNKRDRKKKKMDKKVLFCMNVKLAMQFSSVFQFDPPFNYVFFSNNVKLYLIKLASNQV